MPSKFLIVPLCSDMTSIDEINRCVNSMLGQDNHPFDWDLKVVCNTNDPGFFNRVRSGVNVNFEVVQTESNGGNGMGHNSVLNLYRDSWRDLGFTHLIMIDADDYYYPCAFDCIDDLLELVPDVDYMSVGQNADSVRKYRGPIKTNQPTMEIAQDIWLHSNFNYRFPQRSHVYYDGANCMGGEVTLFLSANAVDHDLHHMECPWIPDDWTHMLWAVRHAVEGKIKLVNTDCNDIYVYDKTNPTGTTNQPDFKFSPADWPQEYHDYCFSQGNFDIILGFDRVNLPFVTLPQYMFPTDKAEFIRKKVDSIP